MLHLWKHRLSPFVVSIFRLHLSIHRTGRGTDETPSHSTKPASWQVAGYQDERKMYRTIIGLNRHFLINIALDYNSGRFKFFVKCAKLLARTGHPLFHTFLFHDEPTPMLFFQLEHFFYLVMVIIRAISLGERNRGMLIILRTHFNVA